MALARVKTWGAEVLTYADLNAEFNNVLNNANSLISPFTGNVDGGGFLLSKLGTLIVGNTSTQATAGSAHASQFLGTSATTTGQVNGMFSADAVGASVTFAKSRHATIGSHTIVQSGDVLGQLTAYGDNGSSFDPAAQIKFISDGTPGAATDMPGAIVFYTTPDGSATLTQRFKLTKAGSPEFANLTSGRLVFTTTNGGITDSANVLYDGTTATITNNSSGTSPFICTNTAATAVRAGAFLGGNAGGSGTPTNFTITVASPDTGGDADLIGFYTDSGTLRGYIDYNRAGGAIRYNTSSDHRAKSVAGEYAGALELVNALKVYDGLMNGATMRRPMMVAHEAQEIVPYAVSGVKDAVDKDGNPAYQGMDHSILVPLLIAALQEASAKINALEGK